MPLTVKDNSKVYQVQFHSDDVKISNIGYVSTTKDADYIKPSYRTGTTNDNMGLRSETAIINFNTKLESDFLVHFILSFDSKDKDYFTTTSVKVPVDIAIVNSLYDKGLTYQYESTIDGSSDIVFTRAGSKLTLFLDGKEVQSLDNFNGGVEGIYSQCKCLLTGSNIQIVIDDIVVNDGDSMGSSFSKDTSKSIICNNSIAIDGNKNAYGVVAKV